MPIYRTNTCNTLNLQTLTGELRFSSSAIDKRRKEGEKGRWIDEGEGRKVKGERGREEGDGRKVKGGR